MPRWNPPATIKKMFVQNEDTERLGEFLSRALMPVHFERHPSAMSFHHRAEIGIIGDILIWNEQTESGYSATWKPMPSRRFEIHFVDAGGCSSSTATQNISACAGQSYLLHDTRQHRVLASPGMRKLSVSIPFSRYAKLVSSMEADPADLLCDLLPLIDASSPAARAIRGIAAVLHADGEQDNPFSSVPLPAAILKEALLQALISSWPNAKCGTAYRPVPSKIRRATEWIEANLQQKIMVDDIANAAGTSSRTLQVLFQKHFGMSPIYYVTKLRLHHVHEVLLVADNDQAIHIIAQTWGFRNVSDFERYYKDRYGHQPSETRRQARFQGGLRQNP